MLHITTPVLPWVEHIRNLLPKNSNGYLDICKLILHSVQVLHIFNNSVSAQENQYMWRGIMIKICAHHAYNLSLRTICPFC